MALVHFDDIYFPTYDTVFEVIYSEDLESLKRWWNFEQEFPDNFESLFIGTPEGRHYLVFNSKDIFNVVHECVHARQHLFKVLGMYDDNIFSSARDEAEAYFTEALVREVLQTLNEL